MRAAAALAAAAAVAAAAEGEGRVPRPSPRQSEARWAQETARTMYKSSLSSLSRSLALDTCGERFCGVREWGVVCTRSAPARARMGGVISICVCGCTRSPEAEREKKKVTFEKG